jgi:hypothetical protein
VLQFTAHFLGAILDQLLDFAVLDQLLLFELRLLREQGLHRLGINAVKLRGEFRELVLQREVVRAELIHLGLFHRAFRIEHERAVALNVERRVLLGNFRLRLVFEFEWHNAPRTFDRKFAHSFKKSRGGQR